MKISKKLVIIVILAISHQLQSMELTNASYKLVDAVNKSSCEEFKQAIEAQGHQVNTQYLEALQTINETQKRALQEALRVWQNRNKPKQNPSGFTSEEQLLLGSITGFCTWVTKASRIRWSWNIGYGVDFKEDFAVITAWKNNALSSAQKIEYVLWSLALAGLIGYTGKKIYDEFFKESALQKKITGCEQIDTSIKRWLVYKQ